MNEPEFNRTEGWQSPASAEDGTHTHRHYRQADKRQERSNHHLTISSALGAFANSFGDMQVLGIKLHRPPPSPTHPRLFPMAVAYAITAWAVPSARAFTKSEYRREHHAVCRARRPGQQLQPRRATVWPGWPLGAIRRSTGPTGAFRSFAKLWLQLYAS